MERVCDTCGGPYAAKSRRSRFCSDRCRARNRGRPRLSEVPPAADGPVEAHPLLAATARELTELGVADTVLGLQAMRAAEKTLALTDTGSAFAAASKEFSRLMAEARSGGEAVEDEVTRARRRRDEKRSAAGKAQG